MSDNSHKLRVLSTKIDFLIREMRLIQQEINCMIDEDRKALAKGQSEPLVIKRGKKTYRIE